MIQDFFSYRSLSSYNFWIVEWVHKYQIVLPGQGAGMVIGIVESVAFEDDLNPRPSKLSHFAHL